MIVKNALISVLKLKLSIQIGLLKTSVNFGNKIVQGTAAFSLPTLPWFAYSGER